jgi:hypothetical protein
MPHRRRRPPAGAGRTSEVGRAFRAGLLAIAMLAAASLAAVSWLTRGGQAPEPPAPNAATKVAEGEPPADAPPTGETSPASDRSPDLPPAASPAATPWPHPTGRDPIAVMPAARRRALRAFRRELTAGLAALRERVQACPAANGGPPSGASPPSASFVLEVETVEGGLRIVDASPEGRGSPGDPRVACARAALRGQLIPAPSAEPGRRWQLPFSP